MIQVFAYRPGTTERFKQMQAVWDACATAGLEPPPEVTTYLNTRGRGPRPDAEEVPIVETAVTRTPEGAVEIDLERIYRRGVRLLVVEDDGA